VKVYGAVPPVVVPAVNVTVWPTCGVKGLQVKEEDMTGMMFIAILLDVS